MKNRSKKTGVFVLIGVVSICGFVSMRFYVAQKNMAKKDAANRVADTCEKIQKLQRAIIANERRENSQAQRGFGLSDEAYWAQANRNMQEYRELMDKKARLEVALIALGAICE